MLATGAGAVAIRLEKLLRPLNSDEKMEEISGEAGEAKLYPAVRHLPENLIDKPFELVLA
jgi:hypothetical protein